MLKHNLRVVQALRMRAGQAITAVVSDYRKQELLLLAGSSVTVAAAIGATMVSVSIGDPARNAILLQGALPWFLLLAAALMVTTANRRRVHVGLTEVVFAGSLMFVFGVTFWCGLLLWSQGYSVFEFLGAYVAYCFRARLGSTSVADILVWDIARSFACIIPLRGPLFLDPAAAVTLWISLLAQAMTLAFAISRYRYAQARRWAWVLLFTVLFLAPVVARSMVGW